MSEVQDQVKKIVVDHLGIDEAKVTPEAKFIDDLGADSLDTVELVMAFEEKFGIEIPDDAAETIQTVQNAIDFIHEFFKFDNNFGNLYSKKLFNFLESNSLFKKYSTKFADKGIFFNY